MLSSDSISVDIGSPKKWRINGIIEIMNFHKFRVDVISIMNFFKNGGKAGEFLRKADNYFTTPRVTGKVTIELPNGVTGIIVDLENDNRYIHFAEPIYFSFEYESKLAGSKFKITCDLKETDTGKSLCDGTHEYSSQSPLTGMMKSPSNSVSSVRSNALRRHLASFKAQLKQLKQELNQEDLISSTVDIIAKVMNLYGYEKLYQSVGASDIKECLEQLMAFPALIEGASLTEKIALAMELLHNVTGAFLINLNTEKIKESGQQPHRIEGDWQVTKADPASNKHVEGFGQLYLLPEASIFSLGDFAESLGLTLPDIVSDIEIPFVGGPSFPLYEVFRNEESKIDYEFDYRLHNRFSANIQSDTPKKYVVFANLWDTDGDGALDFDDCLAKGNALGLEMVDLSQSLSYRFSQCDNDEVVHSMFNSVGDPIIDSEANLVWYKINGSLEISGGNDDAGGSFEPYGKLHINVGQRTVNQDFVIWDVPSDQYSWCKDFPRTYTQPFTIYFREKNDFFESTTEKITFIGKIMEDDTSPNDDDLIADYDGYQINVNSITFGDQAHFKFNGNGEEYWANIVIEASTMEFSEPPEELVDYQLTGSLKIWCDDDAGLESHYEAYGDLTVDIGTRGNICVILDSTRKYLKIIKIIDFLAFITYNFFPILIN